MKILQVCPSFFPYKGGVEVHVEAISRGLIELGVETKVFTTDPSGKLPLKEIINGIEVTRFRSYTTNNIYRFAPSLIPALVRSEDVDIVHVHDYQDYCAFAVALSKHKLRKPIILTPHYHPIGGNKWRTISKKFYGSTIGKFIFSKADVIITVSKFERELLKEKFNLNEQRIRYVPNGVDLNKYTNLICKPNKTTKDILYVGRLEKYKGVQYAIKAFAEVKKVFSDARLIIVGDGSYKSNLVNLANKLRIADYVLFLGNVSESDLLEIYSKANVFVMPSRYEAFCIALAESMACGLPVIATKVGGMVELIEDGKNGFLIEYPPDEKIMANLITRLLDDQQLSSQISQEARNFVLSNFSWRTAVQNLLEIYKDVS